MIQFTVAIAISCFKSESGFTYDILKKQGTLTLVPLVFKDDKQYDLCKTLNGLTFQARVTIQSGNTLQSTQLQYDLNSSYSIIVSCTGEASVQTLCNANSKTSQQAEYDLMFLGIDTKISQTIASYNVNIYNHQSCLLNTQISFKSGEEKIILTGSRSGCDITDTMVTVPGAPDSVAIITLKIFDSNQNDSVLIKKSFLPDIKAINNGVITAVFDCSVLGQNCTDVYNAFQFNYIYNVTVSLKYQMKPRPFNSKTYFTTFNIEVSQIKSDNYPQCYNSIQSTIQPSGIIIGVAPNTAANCVPGVSYQSVEIVLGITGAKQSYVITDTIEYFSFSNTTFHVKCRQNAECTKALTILADDPSAQALFQINFKDSAGTILKYFMSTSYAYPMCFSSVTAQINETQLCLFPKLATNTLTCELLIAKRVSLLVNIKAGGQTLLSLKQFDNVGASQTQICLPCDECKNAQKSIKDNLDKLTTTIKLDDSLYFMDELKLNEVVKSEYIAASICFSLLAVVLVIVGLMIIKM
ncbi:Conserved_hypothetical protein [Hexamita inflata]|uniref:Transmembrane protein n=1 Tax=Hexamita inflata TaxID=28002 RepID=A0AA86PEX3_9EUKA|nr:Conserved hypothetical protein [Hexamita inflata]